ncbi:MAG TPA: sugar ABC transporter substrate-binding protein [Gaiellaceae bacterium]|jgi:ABC-type glycerol-3-phosphate transport system substrate-binding protein
MRRFIGLVLVASVTAALAFTASTSASPKAGGDITVWLSGTYAGATPGSTYRTWLDGVKARYEKKYPGSHVKYVLTPINNAQFTAKIAAAFASKAVPDVMLVYSGGYTTPYMTSSLQKLNDYVNKTPGFYNSQYAWDLSCLNLDCKNGKGDIYAIPNDEGTYALFYNKALFKKAGVARPPKTYDELLTACKKFKAAGIIPLAYGDRDGYSTDNWVTYDYASYMAPGDIAKVNAGEMKYSDPKLVKPLEKLVRFKQQGCVNPDASTHENNDANTYFTSGKAAMVQMFPFVIKQFEKALGKNLGVTRLPQSGPHAGRSAANSFHNWVIPRNAKNKDAAWDFIQLAVDKTGASSLANVVGALPTNKTAVKGITDPNTKLFLDAAAKPQVPLLDSVVPVKVALLYYVQLQAAFSGKTSPQQAMQNVDKGLKTLNP